MPLVYALVGVSVPLGFGYSTPSLLSAGALVGAALLTAVWRYTHRVKPRAERKPPASAAREEWEQRRARGTQTMRFK